MASEATTELDFASLTRQAQLVRDGEASPRELVEAALARIERLDPELNAFRVVFAERALAEAEQAQARMKAGEERPLLGVPIAIKDDTDVGGEPTCFGTDAYTGPAAADAEVVRRLRAAGAIVVGKTNVPELMIFPWTESKTFGITRNPWNRDRTPGGSSGGSAAAVASGMVAAALGSDGGGSIRIPAACCGIFGLKPHRDRIPLTPIAEEWHGLSVVGPLTRTVADAALFLDIAAGTSTFAAAAAAPPAKLRIGMSIKGMPGGVFKLDPEVRAAVERAGELLRSLGHEVVVREPSYGPMFLRFAPLYLNGIAQDAARAAHPERMERRTRSMARMGRALAPFVAASRAAQPALTARVNAVFEDVDVLLSPVVTRTALPVSDQEGHGALRSIDASGRFAAYTPEWNYTGNPAASVPFDIASDGLPINVQLVGRPQDEATLLSLSAQIESARPWADRRPPIS